jgi:hypothetical protein
MDEFGSRFQHSDTPNVAFQPLCYAPTSTFFTVFFPLEDLEPGSKHTHTHTHAHTHTLFYLLVLSFSLFLTLPFSLPVYQPCRPCVPRLCRRDPGPSPSQRPPRCVVRSRLSITPLLHFTKSCMYSYGRFPDIELPAFEPWAAPLDIATRCGLFICLLDAAITFQLNRLIHAEEILPAGPTPTPVVSGRLKVFSHITLVRECLTRPGNKFKIIEVGLSYLSRHCSH